MSDSTDGLTIHGNDDARLVSYPVRISRGTRKALELIAARHDRSLAQEVRRALREYVEREEAKS
jgi:predicted transcriptional regulator